MVALTRLFLWWLFAHAFSSSHSRNGVFDGLKCHFANKLVALCVCYQSETIDSSLDHSNTSVPSHDAEDDKCLVLQYEGEQHHSSWSSLSWFMYLCHSLVLRSMSVCISCGSTFRCSQLYTHTSVLQLLFSLTCVSWHPQLSEIDSALRGFSG